jgi:hypothetical protein
MGLIIQTLQSLHALGGWELWESPLSAGMMKPLQCLRLRSNLKEFIVIDPVQVAGADKLFETVTAIDWGQLV